ncbi:hypothetical protein MXM51_01530 [Pantoea stewartii]|uniref:hypothetical protein n=1 Tax=Pantoea stewartii TaxID=66269 RepID=UPI002DBF85DB|nr:hypothetical protein [Pantoea stewartii]MEB6533231.1 hypothetical protein [Pantoea stewartii]
MIKLPDETEMKWRDLALQFDGHRIQAISLLKMIINDAPDGQYLSVRNFLKSAPLPGEEVLRKRIAEIAEVQRLNATAQPVSDGCKVPEGWKLVPIEPTTQMYEAGDRQLTTKQVWDSMLAAAPGGQDD